MGSNFITPKGAKSVGNKGTITQSIIAHDDLFNLNRTGQWYLDVTGTHFWHAYGNPFAVGYPLAFKRPLQLTRSAKELGRLERINYEHEMRTSTQTPQPTQ